MKRLSLLITSVLVASSFSGVAMAEKRCFLKRLFVITQYYQA